MKSKQHLKISQEIYLHDINCVAGSEQTSQQHTNLTLSLSLAVTRHKHNIQKMTRHNVEFHSYNMS